MVCYYVPLSSTYSLPLSAHKVQIPVIARILGVANLHELIRRFLRVQLYADFDEPDEVVPLNVCPWLRSRTQVAVHYGATATFFAPSELCDPSGMHSESIRCTPRWRKGTSRYDTVFVQLSEDKGMAGMSAARVRAFLSFAYGITLFECALVEWFETVDDHPDPVTGMWVVRPELLNRRPALEIIPVDSIVRSCHLIGVYGTTRIPSNFQFSDSLDAFRRFYVNHYADYHAHEILK